MSETTDQPTTYRAILETVVGAEALREAEARVYDQPAPDGTQGQYMCRDGFCALGIIARSIYQFPDHAPHFPCSDDVVLYDLYGFEAWNAAETIIKANDRGELATPGSLTALLDSAVL